MEGADLNRLTWRKARRSSDNGGACVEVAAVRRTVAVRNSKDPDGPKLGFTPGSWDAFVTDVKRGRFDL